MSEPVKLGCFERISQQNAKSIVFGYLRDESGENIDNLYILYNDLEKGLLLEKLESTTAYILQKLFTDDRCILVRRMGGLSGVQEKGYTKADYIMALHKEYGCDLKTAEKAHDYALEYLRSLSKLKG